MGIIIFSCRDDNDKKNTQKQIEDSLKEKINEKDPDSLIAVIMVGDIMMGTNYPTEYSLPPDDGKDLFSEAKEYLEIADLTLGNLEGTLLDKGGTPKECLNPENCVSFRMPERYGQYLKDAGFDIMSTANNHSGDFGEKGRSSTVKTLDEYGIKHAGYEFDKSTVLEKDGVKFGFTAFAPNSGTQSLLNLKAALKSVKELRSKCDILIVSFHGGAEGSGATGVNRKREFYLGEDRGNIYEFSHAMIDAGADIVFGHGPHVPRGIELYNDRLIAYSLGNFCTYGKFGLSGNLGLAPILKVYTKKTGEFDKGRIFPFKQVRRGFPVFDEEYRVVELIKRLSEKDFPESELLIESDGRISRK
jgi:poly-gamma-glutamate capsule biosynthesis protein CapA/YwtB (metallophosphatase superfamily)